MTSEGERVDLKPVEALRDALPVDVASLSMRDGDGLDIAAEIRNNLAANGWTLSPASALSGNERLLRFLADDHEPGHDTGNYGLRDWDTCDCGWSGKSGGRWLAHFQEAARALLSEPASAPEPSYIEVRTTACHAGMDGDCSWNKCPQLRDGEPMKSRRHCPLDSIATSAWTP